MPMLSIGIDVSKGKSTVCGMKPGGEIVYAPFEVQQKREGMLELVSLLRSSGEEVRAVLESTGSYHCPVVAALLENGIFVSVINSLRMKRFCSQSIRKVKTDRIDAMQIALYGLAYWQELQPTKLPEDTYRELQLLARQYYQMKHLHITRAALSQKTHYIILLPTPRWKKSFHSTTWISSYCKENKDTVCFIKPVYTSQSSLS